MFQLGEQLYEGPLGLASFEQSKEADYKEHNSIGTKPVTQRVGDKLDTISTSIRLHNAYCIPEDLIDNLENSRNVGYILGLFSRAGRYYGDFLIHSLRTRLEQLNGDGTIMLATVDIELQEYYYKDRAAAARRAARIVGFASALTAIPFPEVPIPESARIPAAGATRNVSTAVVVATSATTQTTAAKPTKTREAATLTRLTQMAGTTAAIVSTARKAVNNPAQRVYLLREVSRQAGTLTAQHGALVAALGGPAPSPATSALLYALSGGSGAASTTLPGLAGILKTQADNGDFAGALATSSALRIEQARLTAAAMPVATAAGIGRTIL